ncbi:MAG: dethiobiotin synthase [Methylobacter sp.]|nr:dethiobiotin synthase [Methylobacter sp.]
MENAYFVTGTDTNVGKTWATIALMQYFQNCGKTVVGMKPVAAGCMMLDGQLKNEDALLIQENGSVWLDYDLINPYAYEQPTSPHIAGFGNPADLSVLAVKFDLLKSQADVVVVEGAGGWYSPLNEQQANSDLAQLLGLPVILVVAIRLGCINHARLTYEAILRSEIKCAGWIAVCTEADLHGEEAIISMIKDCITEPLLGVIPNRTIADFNFFSEQLAL